MLFHRILTLLLSRILTSQLLLPFGTLRLVALVEPSCRILGASWNVLKFFLLGDRTLVAKIPSSSTFFQDLQPISLIILCGSLDKFSGCFLFNLKGTCILWWLHQGCHISIKIKFPAFSTFSSVLFFRHQNTIYSTTTTTIYYQSSLNYNHKWNAASCNNLILLLARPLIQNLLQKPKDCSIIPPQPYHICWR